MTDREYATFGALGEPDEVLGDGYEDPRFLSPAEPRAFRASLAVSTLTAETERPAV